ncbi:MAG: Na+/H+ antiporter subunit G [Pseudomonadota bacterium]
MMETIGAILVGLCLLIGAGFALVGAFGLLKLPDSMTRLHAPTKVGTVGIGALLLASMIHSWVFADGSLSELLIMALLFVTAPISANFMAKVNIHEKACDETPKPPRDDNWSTLSTSEGKDA